MIQKQTIDFSVPNPSQTANFSLPLYQGCEYNPQYSCWEIGAVGGYFKFNLNLPQPQGIDLTFQLCSAIVGGVSDCPIEILVNGNVIEHNFDPHDCNFYNMTWPISANILKAGDNEIRLTLSGGTTKVFMKYATVDSSQIQTIDFTVPNPSQTANYSLPLFQMCEYNPQYTCWEIGAVGGFFKFNLELPQQQGTNLTFQLCSAIVGGKSDCPIEILVNDNVIVSGFDPHNCNFYNMTWPVSPNILKAGSNEVILKLMGGTTKVFMRYATIEF